MTCSNPECLRKFRYARIAFFARKRYLEGVTTIALLCEAATDNEKMQIILASMLDLDDAGFADLVPHCSHRCQCQMLNMRNRLRNMIEREGGGQLAA